MAQIDRLKEILDFQISVGGYKIPCNINPSTESNGNQIMLFYNSEANRIIAIGKKTLLGQYAFGVQVATRHNDYNYARDAAFSALELLGTNRARYANFQIKFLDVQSPEYLGIDQAGMYVWGFDIQVLGDK